MGFIPVAVFRYRMAVNNANRFVAMEVFEPHQESSSTQDAAHITSAAQSTVQALSKSQYDPQQNGTAARQGPPAPVRTVLRESFVTAGSVVAAATAFVGLVEVALLVLILRV
nr:conserved hypothetical protein [Melanopsichium pennsylvanicum 4]